VVHPTVGLPLFLGSVALTSLAVHTAVMTHTTWMGNYWMGSAKAKVAAATPNGGPQTAANVQQGAFSMTVTPVAGNATQPASFTITVTPAQGGAPVVSKTISVDATPAPAKTDAMPVRQASAD
jgi:light-harvesting protein B-800-850 alpha chain